MRWARCDDLTPLCVDISRFFNERCCLGRRSFNGDTMLLPRNRGVRSHCYRSHYELSFCSCMQGCGCMRALAARAARVRSHAGEVVGRWRDSLRDWLVWRHSRRGIGCTAAGRRMRLSLWCGKVGALQPLQVPSHRGCLRGSINSCVKGLL